MTAEPTDVANPGIKFELPVLPLPSNSNIKYRYDPVIKQVTSLLMKDGKLSVAQRVRPSVHLMFYRFSVGSDGVPQPRWLTVYRTRTCP